jgi:Lysozyme like domain/Ricin-type beta-trefoil lectin domain-like
MDSSELLTGAAAVATAVVLAFSTGAARPVAAAAPGPTVPVPVIPAPAVPGPTIPGTQRMASLNPGAGIPAADIDPSVIALCTKVAAKAGFPFNHTVSTSLGPEPAIAVAVAMAMAESGCNPAATDDDPNGSEDRGLWQINNEAWPTIPAACTFQIQCNADAAYTISSQGTNWSPWSSYTNGAWENYLSAAVASVESGFTFQLGNQGANTCLEAANGVNAANTAKANGAPIVQWTCNAGDNYQQWRVMDASGQSFTLQNVAAGTCLDAGGTAKGQGDPIFQWTCDSKNASEQWSFTGSGALNINGNAEAGLQNNEDGTCAAASSTTGNSGKIFQATCSSDDAYQLWN